MKEIYMRENNRMGKILVIAEKPSAGADMACVLGCGTRKDGYIEGDKYIVTWAIGHLIGQKLPEEHDPSYKEWRLSDLPFRFGIDNSLKILPHTAAQFKIVKSLIHRPDVIMLINAGDAGREGYLIQEWIYRLAGNTKPKKVLWASSLTEEALRNAFANLKDPKDFVGILNEAEARAQMDYILGINYSRALSLKNSLMIHGRTAIIHYGRCQIPLLNLLVQREEEIKNFVVEDFYEMKIKYSKGFIGTMIDEEGKVRRFKTSKQAMEVLESIGETATVISYASEEKRVAPPLLYDLGSLQKDMGKKYGYAPDETLSIAQSLYEKHKAISYPRTDSRCLSMDVYNEIEKHLNSLSFGTFKQKLEKMVEGRVPQKRYFDDLKVTDHHALIPTIHNSLQEVYENMNAKEKNVFDAIAEHLIAIFCGDCVYRDVEIQAESSGERFSSHGATILSLGYRSVLKEAEGKEENADKEMLQILPELKVGDSLHIDAKKVQQKKTQPPSAYTVSSIIALMEKYNIGRSATRGALINKLLGKAENGEITSQKAYISQEKTKYVVTELGRAVIRLIPAELKDPQLTNRYELVLEQINKGQLSKEAFLLQLVEEQRSVIQQMETKTEELHDKQLLVCPKCGKEIWENKKAFSCSGWKEGCDFAIWKVMAGKTLTKHQVMTLLTKGRTGMISGFMSKKTGTPFSAALVLTKEFKVEFAFPQNRR